jgi:hypothetical protein
VAPTVTVSTACRPGSKEATIIGIVAKACNNN